MFQSTRPRGARHAFRCPLDELLVVSIHAPAWGATLGGENRFHDYTSFNPRARVGRDAAPESPPLTMSKFQSTRPRGARPETLSWSSYLSQSFQSTRPRGARHTLYARETTTSLVSIHAPAWGATIAHSQDIAVVDVSIHAPAWGATAARVIGVEAPLFQSTRPRGARQLQREILSDWDIVSIHAPAWGAT